MPVRAFLDSDSSPYVDNRDGVTNVSMPVRAFLDSDCPMDGIFNGRENVSMPVRAFLDSDSYKQIKEMKKMKVSMPVRAFLDSDLAVLGGKIDEILRFNARQGIS